MAEPPPAPARPRRSHGRAGLIAGLFAAAVLAAVAFLLLGSTGAGLGGPVARAAALSARTPGYRIQMAMELTSPALSSPIVGTGRGVVDLRDQASSMSLAMDFGNQPQLISRLGSSTLRMDMVMARGVVYVRLPAALTAALPLAGRDWVKVDLGKLSSLPGLSSLGGDPATSDPSRTLDYLRSASGVVLDLGRERIGRLVATHYQAQLTPDDLLHDLHGAARDVIARLRQALPAGGFPVDVWIDRHSLVRRVRMALTLNLPGGQSMQETVTTDLSHYGVQSPPAVPGAGEVTDLGNLSGVGAGG